ncbi:hypothetical protein GOP47_0015650 [Adiantum capillus-veneris]|uniref:Uncharacterized protein n=1 Tax=Adiantum capillus-veneris TaxID=13818 RepID=A0A9D4UK30_ADICA|nr:hypothetical protein GOP47_0015650 [Adiantum capillus-veneris]
MVPMNLETFCEYLAYQIDLGAVTASKGSSIAREAGQPWRRWECSRQTLLPLRAHVFHHSEFNKLLHPHVSK